MIKLKFEPEDFQKAFEMGEAYHGHMLYEMADAANAKLREWIKQAPLVYGGRMETGGGESWRFHEDERAYPWDVTHTARLVDIEEEE